MRTSAVLVALVAAVSAHDFTRMSYPQGGLLRRDSSGYKPEVTSCGSGTTCAEACGSGYELCTSTDKKSHCFNPVAGETCCTYAGVGSSCESGYFCAHNAANTTATNTVCCADGGSLDDCAAKNSLSVSALASDPPATSIISSIISSITSSSISVPLTTAVYSANTTSSVPLYTAPLVTAASISTGFAVHYSANHSILAYTASPAPSTTADIQVTAAGSSSAAAASASASASATDVAISSGSTVVPVAALALVAGTFAAFF